MRKILIKQTLADPIVRNGLLFGHRKELQTVYKEKEDKQVEQKATEQTIDFIAANIQKDLNFQMQRVRGGLVGVLEFQKIMFAAHEEFKRKCKYRVLDTIDYTHYIERTWENIIGNLRKELRKGGNKK